MAGLRRMPETGTRGAEVAADDRAAEPPAAEDEERLRVLPLRAAVQQAPGVGRAAGAGQQLNLLRERGRGRGHPVSLASASAKKKGPGHRSRPEMVDLASL